MVERRKTKKKVEKKVKEIKQEKIMKPKVKTDREEIEEVLRELAREDYKAPETVEQYPEILINGDIKYIREDIAKGKPEEYQGLLPFAVSKNVKKKWYKPWTWFSKPKLESGNMLLLLDNEMGIKLWDGVQPGVFRIKEFEGTPNERENFIILKPNKLRTFTDIEGNLVRMWVADINNAVALPDEPLYSCKAVGEAIRTAVTDRHRFEMGKKKNWWADYMWIIPAILIGLYFLWYFGLLDKILGAFGTSTQAITESAKGGVQNIAGGVAG